MSEPQPQPRRRLDGLKMICAYVHLSERTVRKLASPRTPIQWRIPVFRIAVDERAGRLSAFPADLDAWLERFRARTIQRHGELPGTARQPRVDSRQGSAK
jgi:hypothetical protein